MKKCLERVNDWHFWNPGVFSYAMIPRCHPNSRVFFFHRHIYSLWCHVAHKSRLSAHSASGGTHSSLRSKPLEDPVRGTLVNVHLVRLLPLAHPPKPYPVVDPRALPLPKLHRSRPDEVTAPVRRPRHVVPKLGLKLPDPVVEEPAPRDDLALRRRPGAHAGPDRPREEVLLGLGLGELGHAALDAHLANERFPVEREADFVVFRHGLCLVALVVGEECEPCWKRESKDTRECQLRRLKKFHQWTMGSEDLFEATPTMESASSYLKPYDFPIPCKSLTMDATMKKKKTLELGWHLGIVA